MLYELPWLKLSKKRYGIIRNAPISSASEAEYQLLSLLQERGVVLINRELTSFTSCMGCDPTDERFPTDELYPPSYFPNVDVLTPQRLHSLCSIGNQRTFSYRSIHADYANSVCSVSRDLKYGGQK